MNLLPFTVSVNADPPARAELGESEVAIGSGLSDASTVTGGLVAASVSSSPTNRRNSYVPGGLWHRHRPRPIRDACSHIGPLKIVRVGRVGSRECQPVAGAAEAVASESPSRDCRRDRGRAHGQRRRRIDRECDSARRTAAWAWRMHADLCSSGGGQVAGGD